MTRSPTAVEPGSPRGSAGPMIHVIIRSDGDGYSWGAYRLGTRPATEERVGQLVRANLLAGEIWTGVAAGLGDSSVLQGVGLVDMALVYEPEELTECYRTGDTCWAAIVIADAASELVAGGRVTSVGEAADSARRWAGRHQLACTTFVDRE